ncbi:MAG: hypothetical protein WDN44_09750 [Sphingomonas sp.]
MLSSSAGASIVCCSPIDAIESWGTITVSTRSVPVIEIKLTGRPGPSWSVPASWREITLRSAPVSMMKL